MVAAAPCVPPSHGAALCPVPELWMPPAATHRLVLPCSRGEAETLAARLWAGGALGVWERPGQLVAWFDEVSDAVPEGGVWELEPDRDWQAEWKDSVLPVHAGRFVVVPTWLADGHLAGDDETILVLDPGRAFGSGHHATTALCLEALDQLDLAGRTLADVGCGSGVLAIAAARRGAQVVAVDLDGDAVEVTRENAARNDADVDARHGGIELVPTGTEVVVANLLTDTVASLATDLTRATGTTLIVSGITAERRAVALEPLRAAGYEPQDVRERDGWIVAIGGVA
jgi:ribosomal protein L11 methyltransferase